MQLLLLLSALFTGLSGAVSGERGIERRQQVEQAAAIAAAAETLAAQVTERREAPRALPVFDQAVAALHVRTTAHAPARDVILATSRRHE